MAKKKENNTLYCSFCGRSEREVELLLPGMNGCICNECAERAVELSHEYLDKMSKSGSIAEDIFFRYSCDSSTARSAQSLQMQPFMPGNINSTSRSLRPQKLQYSDELSFFLAMSDLTRVDYQQASHWQREFRG